MKIENTLVLGAKADLNITIQAQDSNLKTEGIVLNVSQGGAYVLAPSIPFTEALIRFESPSINLLIKKCARIDPHREGAQGMAVEFSTLLVLEELELLMDAGVPTSELQAHPL